MSFSFSDEQEEFRRVVRSFLETHSPLLEVRRLMETADGYDRGVWKQLSEQLALPGLHVPEAYGGQGFGFVELGIALEEMGRALYCAPYFASAALGTTAILEAGSEARKQELLPSIAAGDAIATLAWVEPGGGHGSSRWDGAGVELIATPTGDGYRLDGDKTHVLDGHTADWIVVVARSPGMSGYEGLSFFTVAGDAPGLERRLLSTVDATRKQARLSFRQVRAEPLGEIGAGAAELSRVLDRAAVALANEAAGGAQRVLEMAVGYAKTRMQFGRPIGSFQAIKHKCADMLLEVELAKSAAYYAAAAVDSGDAELPALASLAKALVADAYRHAAAENIQIHGGVGFTWEGDAHLYFKRAKGVEVFLGDPAYHRELLAQRWEI